MYLSVLKYTCHSSKFHAPCSEEFVTLSCKIFCGCQGLQANTARWYTPQRAVTGSTSCRKNDLVEDNHEREAVQWLFSVLCRPSCMATEPPWRKFLKEALS